jgi:hypothetical protein
MTKKLEGLTNEIYENEKLYIENLKSLREVYLL